MPDFIPGLNNIQVGGQQTLKSRGAASLGDMVAGGGVASGAEAYTRGMYVGATTADALAQARLRQQEFQGREQAATALEDPSNFPDIDNDIKTTAAAQVRAGAPLGDVVSKGMTDQLTRWVSNNDPRAAHALAALAPKEAVQSLHGDLNTGSQDNPLGIAGVQAPTVSPAAAAGQAAKTGEETAKGQLETREATNPELFHPNMFGPTGGLDADHQQKLAELENSGWIDAAHITRFNANPGMIDASYAAMKQANGTNPGGSAHATMASSEKDFTSASPSSNGGQLVAANTVMQHTEMYRKAMQDVQNGDFTLFNKLANLAGAQTGSAAPNNVNVINGFLARETGKYLSARGGTGDEVKQMEDKFSNALSPEAANGAADTAQQLVAGKLDGQRREYYSVPASNTRPVFEGRFLGPTAQRELGKYDATHPGANPRAQQQPPGPGPGPASPTGLPGVSDIDAELARRSQGK